MRSGKGMGGATAGAVAVAVALGGSELVGGAFGARGLSILGSVGHVVIRNSPQWVEDQVVAIFGLYDKLFLVSLMVAICVGLGALLGAIGRRPVTLAFFTVFAAAGMAAGRADPVATPWAAIVAPLAGAVAGLLVLERLRRSAAEGVAGRRAFLGAAAAFGLVAAAAGAGGRWLLTHAAGPLGITLPRPTQPAPPSSPAWHAEGAAPFMTPNETFYRIDILLDPLNVPLDTWRLRVHGMVERPFELTYDELLAMPLVERDATLTCVSNEVGGELVGNGRWLGVPLEALLARAGVQSGADFLVSRSVDGFTVGCDLPAARDGRTALVAVGMNGQPLPLAHGFPARLLVAGFYGYVGGTKWLQSLELSTLAAFKAIPDARGLNTQNPIKTESRIDTPSSRASISAGPTVIAGVAWAQTRGISRVEVQVDDGPWQEARLAEVPGNDTWRQWSLSWTAAPGPHRLRVRATDGKGVVQIEERQRPAQGGATGWHTIQVTVA